MKPEPTRRDVLRVTVASMLSAVVGGVADGQEGQGRPNILWLVSEDNNPFLGCYGDTLAHTPNIDALARRGLLFRHAFCAAPVCAPSRFTILTGVYPQSCAPANHMRAQGKIPSWLKGFPAHLRAAGYGGAVPGNQSFAVGMNDDGGIAVLRPDQTVVDQAKANLWSAKANLEKAAVATLDARRTYQRNKELFAQNFIARSDLDTAGEHNGDVFAHQVILNF